MAKKKSRAPKRAEKLRMLIVEARYYEQIADKLLQGAAQVLDEAGASYERITVPGALEVPGAIAMAVDAAQKKRAPFDGVVALGCVIQGETYHFDIVSNESARGLMDLTLSQIPVGNGILTVDNEGQAQARVGGGKGHKGAEAAHAALAMVRLKRELAGK
ncbi:MAG: 6,7-dimethyl-8-ribityllumazine synthase [Pseudolabrys sp.]